jgi:hypothetical protein
MEADRIAIHSDSPKPYVAGRTSEQFILTPQDLLDLLALGGEQRTNLFMLEDVNFAPGFYDLKTGLAGEILQKLSNYHCRLAIVGSFAMVRSERFRELMSESNKGSQLRFTGTREAALEWLMK